jgi:hypothetical protein
VVALGETPEDFAAYHAAMRRALSPQDTYEEALVRRLTLLSWRLDRVCRIEAAHLNEAVARAASSERFQAKLFGEPGPPEPPLPRVDVWPLDMTLMARYEATLDRGFQRAVKLLERRQAARRHEAAVATPALPAPADDGASEEGARGIQEPGRR